MNDANYLSPPKAEVWRISDLLQYAKRGSLRIPEFQRNFVWRTDDIVKLFDSIYRGFPIGSLLVWRPPLGERALQTAKSTFGPVTFPADPISPGLVVVDGQQRVTSLVATLLGGARDTAQRNLGYSFAVGFDLDDERFESAPDYELAMQRNSWLPLEVVADTFVFLEWLQSRKPQFTREQTDRANRVARAIRDYDVPVYVVDAKDSTAIRDIFVRLNEGGRPLKKREVFAALQSGREDGLDLGQINKRIAYLHWGAIDEDWLLKALAAVDGHLTLKERGAGAAMKAAGERLVAALERAIVFLRDDALVPRWELLPYHFPILPLVRLFDRSPNLSPADRSILASWIWRGMASTKHRDTSKPTISAALDLAAKPANMAVRALLDSVDQPCPPFTMRAHDFRTALTKLACIVLLQEGPRHLVTGQELDLVVDFKSADWRYIVPGEDRRGTENRVFHPAELNLRERLVEAMPEVAESHCVSTVAQDYLRSGRVEMFFAVRRAEIAARVERFLKSFDVYA